MDTITCTQKVGMLPHIQYCTNCKSWSKAFKTILNVKASWNSWEKKIQRHTPPVHSSYFLQIEKTCFSEWQQQKWYLSITVSFFRCYNIRSTWFISIPALDLAIVHKCKHFSCQLQSQMALFWTRGSIIAYQGHIYMYIYIYIYIYICKCASCPTSYVSRASAHGRHLIVV